MERKEKEVKKIFLVLLLGVAQCAAAEEVVPRITGGADVWIWSESVSASGVDRKELIGGRLQAWANFNKFGTVFRVDVTGIPGQFNQGNPETYQSAAVAVALHYNLIEVEKTSCGPAAGIEYGVLLETKNGETPRTNSPTTWGVGVRCSSRGAVGYIIAGQNQALNGFAATAVVQIPTSSWSAWVVTAGLAERQQYVVKIDTAIRWGAK